MKLSHTKSVRRELQSNSRFKFLGTSIVERRPALLARVLDLLGNHYSLIYPAIQLVN